MAQFNFSGDQQIRPHNVFNELDRHGLTLNLPRLTGERNSDYKKRLLDVFVHRANSSYAGLIYGITRELGLSIRQEFTITPRETTQFPYATISFKDTRCCVYKNRYQDPIAEIDRWPLSGGAYTLRELKEKIEAVESNGTQLFDVAYSYGVDLSQRAMTIYDQESILTEIETISGKGKVINLNNSGVIEGSDYLASSNLTKRISNTGVAIEDFGKGEYRVNYPEGKIECNDLPEGGSSFRYEYRDDEFAVYSSPIIISNLQKQEFKKYLFRQIEQTDDNGNLNGKYENGIQTSFGADIINELLSVHPTTYKA